MAQVARADLSLPTTTWPAFSAAASATLGVPTAVSTACWMRTGVFERQVVRAERDTIGDARPDSSPCPVLLEPAGSFAELRSKGPSAVNGGSRLSKGCPILLSGGSIEVSELIAM